MCCIDRLRSPADSGPSLKSKANGSFRPRLCENPKLENSNGKYSLNWMALDVHLHRNLNQKQHKFALWIAPATAVKLLDSIALGHTWVVHFLYAKAGQYWMQINTSTTLAWSVCRLMWIRWVGLCGSISWVGVVQSLRHRRTISSAQGFTRFPTIRDWAVEQFQNWYF